MTVPRGRSFAIEFCDTVVSTILDDLHPDQRLAETTVIARGGFEGMGWFRPRTPTPSEIVASAVERADEEYLLSPQEFSQGQQKSKKWP